MSITNSSTAVALAPYARCGSGTRHGKTRQRIRLWLHGLRQGQSVERIKLYRETGEELQPLNVQTSLFDELFDACKDPGGDFARQFAERMDKLASVNVSQRDEIHEMKTLEMALKETLRRERLTKSLIQLMSRSSETSVILEIISRQICLFLGVDRCLVAYYAPRQGDNSPALELRSQSCRSEDILPVRGGDIPPEMNDVFQDDNSVWTYSRQQAKTETVAPPIREYMEKYGVESALAVQIGYAGRVLGRLVLHQCSGARDWSQEDIEFLEVLAVHIGIALYQAELYQNEKRLRGEAEEANRQKTSVLSFVSHDLKNPLASILRFTEILQGDKAGTLTDEYREIVGFINEGARQMQGMITGILDKTRLENGRMTPTLESIPVQDFIDGLMPTFDALASLRNIRFTTEIDPNLPEILGDPIHLRQILINLLSNAVKYNREKGTAHLRMYKNDNQTAVIELKDNGMGIAPEKIPRLFVEYYRTDLTATNTVEGTGLGLAFIKKLVDLHGGRIDLETELNAGSTFRVTLPLSRPVAAGYQPGR